MVINFGSRIDFTLRVEEPNAKDKKCHNHLKCIIISNGRVDGVQG